MTVAVAWIRRILDCEELVFVTDSRLSGDGRYFDACPKILTLPRSDCAIAFAGYTGHAYPMMHQLAFAIDSYGPARRGSLDLTALKSHALKIFDELAIQITSSLGPSAPITTEPEAEFLFGGYSWVKKRFELWSIRFDRASNRHVAEPAQWLSYSKYDRSILFRRKSNLKDYDAIGRIAFAGDQAKNALERLASRLAGDGSTKIVDRLDMEPLEVVRDMLRDRSHAETIGGSPQITKVYQYMHAAPLAVYWPKKLGGRVFLQGRPLLGYERSERWIIDPDTFKSEAPQHPRNDVDDGPAEVVISDVE